MSISITMNTSIGINLSILFRVCENWLLPGALSGIVLKPGKEKIGTTNSKPETGINLWSPLSR